MNLRVIALATTILPVIAVHGSYLLAASYGQVDWCNPYIDSCTSISATGRQPPASYLFRAIMLPVATIMMMYWWCNYAWLNTLLEQHSSSRSTNNWMLLLGILACIGLIIYVTVLGESGQTWARQRRIGTALFFSFTYMAQLLFLAQLYRLKSLLRQVPRILLHVSLGVCVTLLLLGVLTLILDAWNKDAYDAVEDAFEWVLSALLQGNFLLGYLIWHRSGWFVSVQLTSNTNDKR